MELAASRVLIAIVALVGGIVEESTKIRLNRRKCRGL